MSLFVEKDSVVRKIWGKSDTVLFIFAGASAEFALNKAVDWLYFTGRLPSDPLNRLFSTVTYARQIVFSDTDQAHAAINRITSIHQGVERARGGKIPDWAYRDVLFMLIDYSIRSYEVLEKPLNEDEKAEIFNVFYRVGRKMDITGLPETFSEWKIMRKQHLEENLIRSGFTIDLYKQYQKHLGAFRYLLLKQVQMLVVPEKVNQLLSLGPFRFLSPILRLYKLSRRLNIERFLRNAVLPAQYKNEIRALDNNPG